MCGIASGCKCFFKKPKVCICGTAFLLYTDKNLKDMEHWIHSHKFWVLVLIRRGSRGGEMGECSPPPPPLFLSPLLSFFSYPSNIDWIYYIITKNHPHFKILDPCLLSHILWLDSDIQCIPFRPEQSLWHTTVWFKICLTDGS